MTAEELLNNIEELKSIGIVEKFGFDIFEYNYRPIVRLAEEGEIDDEKLENRYENVLTKCKEKVKVKIDSLNISRTKLIGLIEKFGLTDELIKELK